MFCSVLFCCVVFCCACSIPLCARGAALDQLMVNYAGGNLKSDVLAVKKNFTFFIAHCGFGDAMRSSLQDAFTYIAKEAHDLTLLSWGRCALDITAPEIEKARCAIRSQ